jgi:nucleoside-diphosphate-sugar epimerase
MRKIVISGATSMLGSALMRSAMEEGCEVLCIVRPDSTRLDNLPASGSIQVLYAGLPDYASLPAQDKNYDIFFHLAWDKTFHASRDDIDAQLGNIHWTFDAVRLAKRLGCEVFIGAGSQAEYGIVHQALTPETPADPQSGYGIAKYAAGKLSRLLCEQLKMRFNWLRILSTFGPLDGAHTVIMYTLRELCAGNSPALTKCEQIWDYLYCDDAAQAFLAVGRSGVHGKSYPLGSGAPRRLDHYLTALQNIVAPGVNLGFGKKEYYPHQPMFLCADISELTADTGWKPRVLFEEGIRKILMFCN